MKSIYKIVLVSLFLVAFIAMTGCTRHPNEKQVGSLEETIKAANAAQAELDETVSKRKNLEQEVKEVQNKLEAAKKEKAAVEARLK